MRPPARRSAAPAIVATRRVRVGGESQSEAIQLRSRYIKDDLSAGVAKQRSESALVERQQSEIRQEREGRQHLLQLSPSEVESNQKHHA